MVNQRRRCQSCWLLIEIWLIWIFFWWRHKLSRRMFSTASTFGHCTSPCDRFIISSFLTVVVSYPPWWFWQLWVQLDDFIWEGGSCFGFRTGKTQQGRNWPVGCWVIVFLLLQSCFLNSPACFWCFFLLFAFCFSRLGCRFIKGLLIFIDWRAVSKNCLLLCVDVFIKTTTLLRSLQMLP